MIDWFSCSSHQYGFLLDGGLHGDVERDARGAALKAELMIGNTYIRGPVKKLAVPLAKGKATVSRYSTLMGRRACGNGTGRPAWP